MSSPSASLGGKLSNEAPSQLQQNLHPIKLRYTPIPAPLPPLGDSPISLVASSDTGAPCRRCLQDAQPGEVVNLISYDPFQAGSTSPYRGTMAIFVHEHDCELFDGDTLPEKQLQRLLSLRAFDERDMMVAAEVIKGREMEKVARGMLADEKARYLHVHNAKPGCFAVRVDRA